MKYRVSAPIADYILKTIEADNKEDAIEIFIDEAEYEIDENDIEVEAEK